MSRCRERVQENLPTTLQTLFVDPTHCQTPYRPNTLLTNTLPILLMSVELLTTELQRSAIQIKYEKFQAMGLFENRPCQNTSKQILCIIRSPALSHTNICHCSQTAWTYLLGFTGIPAVGGFARPSKNRNKHKAILSMLIETSVQIQIKVWPAQKKQMLEWVFPCLSILLF